MELAPIILFVYNRPEHTKKTLDALKANFLAEQSDLFIFSDGPKNEKDINKIKLVHEIIDNTAGFKKIIIKKNKENQGLANSIISGVTEIINQYGKVIVLEDDIVTARFFLKYMNDALDFYQNYKKVYSITGFNYPNKLLEIPKNYQQDVYFSYRSGSWSWATWLDKWQQADWNLSNFNNFIKDKKQCKVFNRGGDDLTDMLVSQKNNQIDSWSIRWSFTHYLNDAYCVYPVISFVDNIGNDGSGIHCPADTRGIFRNIELNSNNQIKFISHVIINKIIIDKFKKIFKQNLFNNIIKYFTKML